MNDQTAVYQKLLAEIYNPSGLLADKAGYAEFESTRRFLDVTRLIHRIFGPLTLYINENEKTSLEIEVFSSLHAKMEDYSDLLTSVMSEYIKSVQALKNNKYDALVNLSLRFRKFEDLVEEMKIPGKSEDNDMSLFFSINYYHRASAPSFLYKGLH